MVCAIGIRFLTVGLGALGLLPVCYGLGLGSDAKAPLDQGVRAAFLDDVEKPEDDAQMVSAKQKTREIVDQHIGVEARKSSKKNGSSSPKKTPEDPKKQVPKKALKELPKKKIAQGKEATVKVDKAKQVQLLNVTAEKAKATTIQKTDIQKRLMRSEPPSESEAAAHANVTAKAAASGAGEVTTLVNLASYNGCANILLTTGGNRSSLHSTKGTVETFSGEHAQAVLVGCFTVACKVLVEWSNTALGGKEFTIYPYGSVTDVTEIAVFALEDTTLEVHVGRNLTLTYDIFAGRLQTWGGHYAGKVIDLISTGNVLVTHIGQAQHTGKYVMPIPPAATEVYGVTSRTTQVSSLRGDQVSVQEDCTDGYSAAHTGTEFTITSGDEEYSGRSCKLTVVGSGKIGVTTYDDGSNEDGTSWLPQELFQTITPIPMDMKWVKIVSHKAANCQLDKWDKHEMRLDKNNTFAFTLTGHINVFHYRLDETEALSIIECDEPYMIFGDEAKSEAEIQLITSHFEVPINSYIHQHQHLIREGQSNLPAFNQASFHK